MTYPRTDLLDEDSALYSQPCVFFKANIATVKKKGCIFMVENPLILLF